VPDDQEKGAHQKQLEKKGTISGERNKGAWAKGTGRGGHTTAEKGTRPRRAGKAVSSAPRRNLQEKGGKKKTAREKGPPTTKEHSVRRTGGERSRDPGQKKEHARHYEKGLRLQSNEGDRERGWRVPPSSDGGSIPAAKKSVPAAPRKKQRGGEAKTRCCFRKRFD